MTIEDEAKRLREIATTVPIGKAEKLVEAVNSVVIAANKILGNPDGDFGEELEKIGKSISDMIVALHDLCQTIQDEAAYHVGERSRPDNSSHDEPTTSGDLKFLRDGKLPHARDLIKKGKRYIGPRGKRVKELPTRSEPNSVLYVKNVQSGAITNYAVYDHQGYAIKRVDLIGRGHGPVAGSHVIFYSVEKHPDSGEIYVKPKKRTRETFPEEEL
jgi:hypothetical protein